MVNIVKAVLEVLRDSAEVLLCRGAEVDRWDVRNAVAVGMKLSKKEEESCTWLEPRIEVD